jgi:hypothetical protein
LKKHPEKTSGTTWKKPDPQVQLPTPKGLDMTGRDIKPTEHKLSLCPPGPHGFLSAFLALFLASGFVAKNPLSLAAQETTAKQQVDDQQEGWVEQSEILKRIEKGFADPPDCKKMVEDGRVWIHRDEQAVLVDGYICQRNAPLEMFACPIGTKEHESIVAVFAKSRFVHASLLAVGGVPGKPVAFDPKFTPASGTTIRVYALWHNEKGETQATLAQHWIRQTGTKKPMFWDWVFAGSKIYKDPETGSETYMGDGGELLSVANFMTSTLDVAVKSDAANAGLVFEAFTEKIPKRFTPVRLVLLLSDETPYTEDSSGKDKDAELPKHLKTYVPKRLLEFLPAKKS